MVLFPHRITRRHTLWVALVLAFSITCASAADELESVADQPIAEEFSLIDLDGKTHHLSDYAGKVVLVSFWATWCPECIFEMPSLQALSNTFSVRDFIVLAINVGEDQKRVRAFADRHKLTFPIFLDHDLEAYKKWPVLGVPTSFIINQQGKIIYSVVGAIEWSSSATMSKIRALSNFNKVNVESYYVK